MIQAMDTLLAGYEQGALTRRELLQGLAVLAAPPVTQQARDGVLLGRNLNHVNLQVADVDRSVEFYRRLFSLPPRRLIPGRPDVVDLPDGDFIALARSDEPGVINHFDVGVAALIRNRWPRRCGAPDSTAACGSRRTP